MRVAVIMGSMSDLNKVEPAILLLKKYDVKVDVFCLSAHRTPEKLAEVISDANSNGTEVIIGAAGMAAALPGVIASHTILPVIGLPIKGASLDGIDALLSIVQMPSGIPVATVAIDGSKNAAYLALQIIANKHDCVKNKLLEERKEMKNKVLDANEELANKY